MSQATSRRLCAILYADVVGYSRLMGENEDATHRRVSSYLDLIADYVHRHHGRLSHFAGDAVLADFDSAVDAISCALSVQRDLEGKNEVLPADSRVSFRVGLNVGDVIVDRGEVHGDGVNVAARLEALAEPGGVCASEAVRTAVGTKAPADFVSLGEQQVKNIVEPVRCYRVRLRPGAVLPTPPAAGDATSEEDAELVFASQAFENVLARVRAVARTDVTVLIQGESGVGKELIARRVHAQSERCNGPFVKLDCASLPGDLFESEFLGHAIGAFTGATRDRVGRMELADGGTLFLDGVGELSLDLQAKLLRPFHDSSFERVGESRTRRSDVRFVVATNRSLSELVSAGKFRRDLYFRVSVFPIEIPPLRERPQDIEVLVEHFRAMSKDIAVGQLPESQLVRLQAYDWPGNVRELKNIVERALVLSGSGELQFDEALPASSLSFPARAPLPKQETPGRGFFTASEFAQLERKNLTSALEAAGWKVAGADGAAARLGVTASRLRSRLKVLEIKRPEPGSLYLRLGGSRSIASTVRELFGRLQTDPQLGRFWARRSDYGVMREETLLADYIARISGGPVQYVGRDMKAAHEGLGISAGDWEIFRDHVRATLETCRVPEAERRELAGFLEGLGAEIVER